VSIEGVADELEDASTLLVAGGNHRPDAFTPTLPTLAAIPLDVNDPEHQAIFGEQARSLNRAIAQLSCEQREAVILHLPGGMKFREIAGLQGISINTAKSWYRYGMENLGRLLSDNGEKMKSTRNIEESIKRLAVASGGPKL